MPLAGSPALGMGALAWLYILGRMLLNAVVFDIRDEEGEQGCDQWYATTMRCGRLRPREGRSRHMLGSAIGSCLLHFDR
jgi:hypothetical protein